MTVAKPRRRASELTRGLREHMATFGEKVVVAVARSVTTELHRENPKDTTWSSLNWIPSVGRPAGRGGPGFDAAHESREAKLALVPFEQAAQAGALREVGSFKLRHGKVFITNYVRYVPKIFGSEVPRAIHLGILNAATFLRSK